MADRIYIRINGETRTIHGWSKYYGISPSTASYRINVLGMPPAVAFTTSPTFEKNRANAIHFICNGEVKSLRQWCIGLGISYEKALQRYKVGKKLRDVLLNKISGPISVVGQDTAPDEDEEEPTQREKTLTTTLLRRALILEKKYFFKSMRKDFELMIPHYLKPDFGKNIVTT